ALRSSSSRADSPSALVIVARAVLWHAERSLNPDIPRTQALRRRCRGTAHATTEAAASTMPRISHACRRRSRGPWRYRRCVLRAGPLELRPGSMTVIYWGRSVALTGYEFTLLRVLAETRGRILSREQILELAQATAAESFERAVDVGISRIRRKLGEDARRPSIIRT